MKKYVLCAVFVLATSGCATWRETPGQCFAGEPVISPATPGELKAVRFVEQRIARSCRPASVECNLQLRHDPTGNISITASRAFLDGNSPRCTHLEGGFETYVFSSQGNYVRVVLGL